MSRATVVNGVKHPRGCCCKAVCDPKGLKGADYLRRRAERAAAEEATRKMLGATAPVQLTATGQALRYAAERANRLGDRDRWNRYKALRAAGVSREAAIAQVDAEFEGTNK
jgi:hypothetical protein